MPFGDRVFWALTFDDVLGLLTQYIAHGGKALNKAEDAKAGITFDILKCHATFWMPSGHLISKSLCQEKLALIETERAKTYASE